MLKIGFSYHCMVKCLVEMYFATENILLVDALLIFCSIVISKAGYS